MLKIHTLPATGGDTVRSKTTSSFYNMKISSHKPPALGFRLRDLRLPFSTHAKVPGGIDRHPDAKFFLKEAERLGNPLREGIRGSPLNHGAALTAVHPVIRTNPVTGWKSVYVNRGFTKCINGITRDESDLLLQYSPHLVTQNHDAQVRFRWNKNDKAIWDNRSTWHCATYDYEEARAGDRVCSLGEAPFLDLESRGLRETLGL